jgi:non-lysosomal glucosylceramidase
MSVEPKIAVTSRTDRRVISGEDLRCVAMPMGGIGTGQIALAGDGGWRQWQMMNRPNHLGHIPNSFFAVYMRSEAVHFTERERPEDVMGRARVLMSDALYDDADFKPSVTVSDHIVPEESRRLLRELPGVASVEYIGEYPIAELTFTDPAFPLPVHLTAYSPFAPLDAELSGYPAIIATLSVTNTTEVKQYVSFAATQQNPVGWDGVGKNRGMHFGGFGGNVNRVAKIGDMTAIEMTSNRLARDDARWGEMALASFGSGEVSWLGRFDSLDTFWAAFSTDGQLGDTDDPTPTGSGSTVCGALARGQWLEPGESLDATFVISWYFPNHYVNWGQEGFGVHDQKSKFWIGTNYGNRFSGALDVAQTLHDRADEVGEATKQFRDTFYDSSLPYWLLDAATSQASIIRSPTCLWLEDGTLQGFEGCHGASTGSPENTGGCCPLNCTHVWNYEQALARLFPQLEQTMRRTDLKHQMTDAGQIGFRTVLPLYLDRWDNPAADGQCGTILKTYREWRASGDREFLDEMYPDMRTAMRFIISHWDSDRDGLLSGAQHNTYDIDLHGWSSFTSSMYIAALRAAEEMANLCDDPDFASECRAVYEIGRKNLDAELWNGEYYIQKPDAEKSMEHQYGTGCHIDQILGQWWAHVCDLGHILPEDHIHAALKAIVSNNWRGDFVGFKQTPRIYASNSDEGTLACTWPHGGEPEKPTLYSHEVWNGLEYQLASSLLFEGLIDEALQVAKSARDRYSGSQRNPWNEVECGDHYARSMSSWTLIEAASGYRYDAGSGVMGFAPCITPDSYRAPFVAANGWGTYAQTLSEGSAHVSIRLSAGTLMLSALELSVPAKDVSEATLDGQAVSVNAVVSGDTLRIEFADTVEIGAGQTLTIHAQ